MDALVWLFLLGALAFLPPVGLAWLLCRTLFPAQLALRAAVLWGGIGYYVGFVTLCFVLEANGQGKAAFWQQVATHALGPATLAGGVAALSRHLRSYE